ncbi:hypothetical protein [Ruegeria arenilitoris]|uniref:hypothetical protein n=1 Tax=Ruegeria arenilitoris TaxID=1173585 RepID=UPI001C2C6D30|nr:hypothetical protein [Ruegeria arenilitoris]
MFGSDGRPSSLRGITCVAVEDLVLREHYLPDQDHLGSLPWLAMAGCSWVPVILLRPTDSHTDYDVNK